VAAGDYKAISKKVAQTLELIKQARKGA